MSTKAQVQTQAKAPAGPAAAHAAQPPMAVAEREAERPDIATQLEGAARLGHSLEGISVDGAAPSSVQRQEVPDEEEEELQMQREPVAVQRQELPEEEEEELQMQPETAAVQRQVLPEEEEEELQMQREPAALQRQELPEEEEEELQMQPETAAVQRQGRGEGFRLDDETASRISRVRGGGRPLEGVLQVQMGESLGHEFSSVRVHTDAEADALNRQLCARAFTTGRDIFFRQGEYNPGSGSGRELLSHELAHVVQQSSKRIREEGGSMTVRPAGDAFEQEANQGPGAVSGTLPTAIQREPWQEYLKKKLAERRALLEPEEKEAATPGGAAGVALPLAGELLRPPRGVREGAAGRASGATRTVPPPPTRKPPPPPVRKGAPVVGKPAVKQGTGGPAKLTEPASVAKTASVPVGPTQKPASRTKPVWLGRSDTRSPKTIKSAGGFYGWGVVDIASAKSMIGKLQERRRERPEDLPNWIQQMKVQTSAGPAGRSPWVSTGLRGGQKGGYDYDCVLPLQWEEFESERPRVTKKGKTGSQVAVELGGGFAGAEINTGQTEEYERETSTLRQAATKAEGAKEAMEPSPSKPDMTYPRRLEPAGAAIVVGTDTGTLSSAKVIAVRLGEGGSEEEVIVLTGIPWEFIKTVWNGTDRLPAETAAKTWTKDPQSTKVQPTEIEGGTVSAKRKLFETSK